MSGPVATTPGEGSSATSSRTHGDVGMRGHPLVHRLGEDLAVHRQRRAARHARHVGAREQHAAERAQLGLEQAVGVGEVDGFEGVAADQLGQPVGVVGRRLDRRPHLVQGHPDAALRERPGRLRAGETAADDGAAFTPAPPPRARRGRSCGRT